MLVTTNFHDYYDTISKYGVDKTIVYNRKSLIVPIIKKYGQNPKIHYRDADFTCNLPLLPYTFRRKPNYYTYILGFCGKTYKIIQSAEVMELRHYAYVATSPENFIYETDAEFNETLKVFNKAFLNDSFADGFQFPLSLFQFLNTPVFILKRSKDLHNHELELNPSLKAYKFMKVVDPYSAFQEISQFISGVLGNSEKQTVDISDENRLLQHGFDKKFSFRHPVK